MAIGPEGRVPSAPDRYLVLSIRLRDRRRSLGLTQQQVVRRLAGFGVTTTNKALSSLEHGAGMDVAKLPEFAAALDCTVTYLLGLTDDPDSWQPDAPLGRRTPPPVGQTPVSRPSPEVPAARPAVTVRSEPTEPISAERPASATTWILGPYPAADGVPGGLREDPTAP